MQRRDFLKSTVAVAVAAELGLGKAQARIPAHNWGSYDFGSGPTRNDRLKQGPFLGGGLVGRKSQSNSDRIRETFVL